tara:strand:- start:774 stop:971 length:198 start_codon:yes stop_codon:yes gene_type:complete
MKPNEMEEAIIRNLPDKTGKSLDDWFVVLKDSEITEKRNMNLHLKEVHGLGHFQAQVIVKLYLER